MANDRSSGSERSPSQAEVIRRALRAFGADLRVCLPGVVTKWDASIQRADVMIPVKQAYIDEEDNRQVESWPVVTGVPVEFMGAGNCRLTLPICDGNTVTDSGERPPATTGALFFSDLSLDKWLTGGGGEVDPEIDHQHDVTDAIFIPGLRTFGSPWSSCPTDHATLGHDSGVQAHFRKNFVVVASNEMLAQLVARADKVESELSSIQTALTTHTHSGVTTGPGNTGTSNSSYVAGTVGCDELKAK